MPTTPTLAFLFPIPPSLHPSHPSRIPASPNRITVTVTAGCHGTLPPLPPAAALPPDDRHRHQRFHPSLLLFFFTLSLQAKNGERINLRERENQTEQEERKKERTSSHSCRYRRRPPLRPRPLPPAPHRNGICPSPPFSFRPFRSSPRRSRSVRGSPPKSQETRHPALARRLQQQATRFRRPSPASKGDPFSSFLYHSFIPYPLFRPTESGSGPIPTRLNHTTPAPKSVKMSRNTS